MPVRGRRQGAGAGTRTSRLSIRHAPECITKARVSAKRTTTTKPLTTNTPHEPSQPTACYVAESSPAPYTNAGVDVALANVIGATFFAVLVLFGFYAVYRGFQSRERAKRRIASDIIRVLKEDEERAVKYKVLQLTQPGGEVAAAMRCRDEEQVPGAPGGPTVNDDVNAVNEGLMASLQIQVEIHEARTARHRARVMCGLAVCINAAIERMRGRRSGGGGGRRDLSERFGSLSLDELMLVQHRLRRRQEQQMRLDTLRFQRTQAPVSVVVENP